MPEDKLGKLARVFARRGNTDHLDMSRVDKIAVAHGADKLTGRQAFFVGRDLKALREGEILDGGDGSETSKVNPGDLLKATFSRGSSKKK